VSTARCTAAESFTKSVPVAPKWGTSNQKRLVPGATEGCASTRGMTTETMTRSHRAFRYAASGKDPSSGGTRTAALTDFHREGSAGSIGSWSGVEISACRTSLGREVVGPSCQDPGTNVIDISSRTPRSFVWRRMASNSTALCPMR
jgi:hypothetical protein